MISRSEAYAIYADDYQSVDGIEPVTFTPRNPAGDAVAGVIAKRCSLTTQQSGGGLVTVAESDVTFTIWDITLAGATPNVGDLVTDAANVDYVMLRVVREYWNTRWRIDCRQEVA